VSALVWSRSPFYFFIIIMIMIMIMIVGGGWMGWIGGWRKDKGEGGLGTFSVVQKMRSFWARSCGVRFASSDKSFGFTASWS
jgi:hypothetical protein